MELTGEQILPLPRERVWAALNDPEILRASVPGCESFERVDDNQFQMVMAASVGPIKARFKGRMTLTDLQPPQSYSMTFEGSGGAAGFGKGGAHVDLLADGGGTRLVYRSHAQVGGRLAQVGARLIDGVARKMAEDFFGRFTAAVVGPQPAVVNGAASLHEAEPDPATASSEARAATPAAADTASGAGARNLTWALGVVVVLALIAVYALH
ncbi:CoxG family protein [Paraburkholderia dilworthii]|uniref:CoxG family protein n=1 Tax=Paraburkholderia dilworthii TaxID=948106 RepID=UPI0004106364|nr:carbon monoxide dehydrogenase subunit G [Paraburkholderia dilworthii]